MNVIHLKVLGTWKTYVHSFLELIFFQYKNVNFKKRDIVSPILNAKECESKVCERPCVDMILFLYKLLSNKMH